MTFKGKGRGLHIEKDPDEVKDCVIDFSTHFPDDTLASATVTGTNVTVDSFEINSGIAAVTEGGYPRDIASGKALIVWLSGGAVGTEGKVHVRVVTVMGRQRDFTFRVLQRQH